MTSDTENKDDYKDGTFQQVNGFNILTLFFALTFNLGAESSPQETVSKCKLSRPGSRENRFFA